MHWDDGRGSWLCDVIMERGEEKSHTNLILCLARGIHGGNIIAMRLQKAKKVKESK